MIGNEAPGTLWRFTGLDDHWYNKLAMYLGMSEIHRDDGVIVTNYKFLLEGQSTVVDRSFLKFFREVA